MPESRIYTLDFLKFLRHSKIQFHFWICFFPFYLKVGWCPVGHQPTFILGTQKAAYDFAQDAL